MNAVTTDKPVILFVDDERGVLDGLRRQLRRSRDDWDMRFVTSGEAAIEVFAAGPVDILVTDVRMPGVDGLTLLREVRARHPEAVRFVLSGYSPPAEERAVYQVAHRVLPKPCEQGQLAHNLRQAVAVRAVVPDRRVRALVGGVERLPSVPRIYSQLQSVLHDAESDAQAVARVIERDAVMLAAVLRGANSAIFARATPVTRVRDAVTYLGRRMVTSIVLGVAMLDRFRESGISGSALRLFQAHAMAVANVAMRLVERRDRDDAYAAAMLHDIGQLVLCMAFGEVYDGISSLDRDRLVAAEAELFATTHDQVGAYLLGLWGLPVEVVAAVAQHHSPLADGEPEVSRAIRIAELIVDATQTGDEDSKATLDALPLTEEERSRAESWLSDAAPRTPPTTRAVVRPVRTSPPSTVAKRPVTYRRSGH